VWYFREDGVVVSAPALGAGEGQSVSFELVVVALTRTQEVEVIQLNHELRIPALGKTRFRPSYL